MMRVGVYQNHPLFGQVDRNIERAVQDLSEIVANLVVLPELFNTGYQFVSREETEAWQKRFPRAGLARP